MSDRRRFWLDGCCCSKTSKHRTQTAGVAMAGSCLTAIKQRPAWCNFMLITCVLQLNGQSSAHESSSWHFGLRTSIQRPLGLTWAPWLEAVQALVTFDTSKAHAQQSQPP